MLTVFVLYLEPIHPALRLEPFTTTLRNVYRLVHPGGSGWKRVAEEAKQDGKVLEDSLDAWDVPRRILCMFLGVVAVYCTLFATGKWIYGR